MKKNKIVKIAAALLCAPVLLSSCIEETFPEGGNVTSGQVAESPFAMENIAASIPTILITNYIGIGDHFDFGYPGIFGATDRLVGEVFPVSGNLPGGNQYLDRWQGYLYPGDMNGLAANGYCAPFFYLNYYQFIYSANEVISIASQNESGGGEALGIAKAFRAMCYLDMARMYDPLPAKAPNRPAYETELEAVKGLTVPIVREGATLEQLENNPRATREEMFNFILSDLTDAETLLADYQPASKNMPSQAVVYGLLARTYLWLGGFEETYEGFVTGTEAYKKAAEYARKAISASGCTIMTESQWLDPKTGFNTVNSSWMWAMIQTTDTVLNNLLSWAAHMSLEAVYGYGHGAQPGISVFSYERISDTDFRKKSYVTPDRSYAAAQPYMSLTEEEFQTVAPYASYKFHTNSGEKSNFTIANVVDIPMMRVEEMYLIEAEATAHYDEATARTLLTSFMANRDPNYKIPAATTDLVEEIIFQKRIEFWGEGIIYYDMKRLNMSMHNGDAGTNAPSMAKFTTDGRAPWWNCVIPLAAVQQNVGLTGKNNPDPTATVKSN
ncbi:RagB/SusD family nutrient uptake outer membrane protein [uncultured Alistipes sp.]|uniref:RagB/SusD family nutrient uptake outer membrane protein n=1 Tax=uncultured Alistipes sp. TaxID=538949 RepID=UPI00260C4C14|nr:RagB/SusD family nutrient uptake outer membrane protein [uncultured Alistipes sp.]